MQLSLELCKELKAAGFPQEPCERFWIAWDSGEALGNAYDRTHQPVACECPSSDELIALIQSKWPDEIMLRVHIGDSNMDAGCGAFWGNHDTWGTTPAEALARLYIALKEVTGCGAFWGNHNTWGTTPAEALARLYIALKEVT